MKRAANFAGWGLAIELARLRNTQRRFRKVHSMPARSVKHRVYQIVEVAHEGDRTSHIFDVAIVSLIVLTVALTVFETVESLNISWGWAFVTIELLASAVFIVEYLLRVWSCTADEQYSGWRGRLRFMLTPMMVIDLIALVPSVLLFAQTEIAALRAIRLLRLVRLARLTRYSRALRLMGVVIKSKREELTTTLVILFVLLLISASLMYYVEHEAQPEAFSSIPAAMWWGVATLTTVGYGDVYPVTTLGRMLAAVMAVLGIGLFALPAGLMGSGFMEAMEALQKEDDLRVAQQERDIAQLQGHGTQTQGDAAKRDVEDAQGLREAAQQQRDAAHAAAAREGASLSERFGNEPRCPHCGKSLNEHPS